MDPSEHFLGLRLNMYVASVLTVVGVVWFVYSQRHGLLRNCLPPADSEAHSAGTAEPDPARRQPGCGLEPGRGLRSAGTPVRGLQRSRATDPA